MKTDFTDRELIDWARTRVEHEPQAEFGEYEKMLLRELADRLEATLESVKALHF